jgi:hypothetical protein
MLAVRGLRRLLTCVSQSPITAHLKSPARAVRETISHFSALEKTLKGSTGSVGFSTSAGWASTSVLSPAAAAGVGTTSTCEGSLGSATIDREEGRQVGHAQAIGERFISR